MKYIANDYDKTSLIFIWENKRILVCATSNFSGKRYKKMPMCNINLDYATICSEHREMPKKT